MDPNALFAIYVALSLFIAWIWVDYFRLIDIFEKENLFRVLATFLMGAGSVLLVLGLHEIKEEPFGFSMNGTALNDFLYCTFSIGLVEEVAKMIPALLTIFIFRKHINEPVDYVATFCVSALGFAAAENVMYFNSYGAEIISSRAILSNVGHMMFASLTAYGFILVKFRNLKPAFLVLPLFLLLAALLHGVYDFGLFYEKEGWAGTVLTFVFFFFGVSMFSTILNNSLNVSPFFTYKHVVHTSHVATRLLIYYTILFVVQCSVIWLISDFGTVYSHVIGHVYTILPIVLITVIRLSRFKLVKGRWHKLIPELPFSISFGGNKGLVYVKGDPYGDYHVNKHYEEYFMICPIVPNSNYLGQCRKAYIFSKMYINGDIAHYGAKIFADETMQQSVTVLLQIKKAGFTKMNSYPMVAIMDVPHAADLDTTHEPIHTPFIEWAIVKPLPGSKI
jgi:RsiW-degrading membrane proteinase PrsW (M82 family)